MRLNKVVRMGPCHDMISIIRRKNSSILGLSSSSLPVDSQSRDGVNTEPKQLLPTRQELSMLAP